MRKDVLEINTPGELVLWLHLTESNVSMGQEGAEIILDYFNQHNMTLAVRNQELVVKDNKEESSDYKFYSVDDAIHDACEWNLELLQTTVEGMKNPENQAEYNRYSEKYGILKQQEKILDGLYLQTKYERIAWECAFQTIMAALGDVPEELLDKLKLFREEKNGQTKEPAGQEENRQPEQYRKAAEQQERVR